MTSLRIALLSLTLPASILAQQVRRVTVHDEMPPELTVKDIERLSPARIALERQKSLSLGADQMRQLDSLAKRYALHLREFDRSLDTLQNLLEKYHKKVVNKTVDRLTSRPRNDPTTPEERIERARQDSVEQAESDRDRDWSMAARNELNRVLLIIRDDYDAQATATNAVLTEAQRQQLTPILDGASEELTTRLHWARAR